MKTSGIIHSIALLFLVTTASVWSAETTSLPTAPSLQQKAKIQQVKADLLSLSTGLAMYKLNAGDYPTAEQGLKSLVEKPVDAPVPRRWAQLMDQLPKDPWTREYRYVVREKDEKITHVLISDGPDARDPADDIEHTLEQKPN